MPDASMHIPHPTSHIPHPTTIPLWCLADWLCWLLLDLTAKKDISSMGQQATRRPSRLFSSRSQQF